jgi:hypothetical protein
MKNSEYRWKPEMVTPRHSLYRKAVTITKEHPNTYFGWWHNLNCMGNKPAEIIRNNNSIKEI